MIRYQMENLFTMLQRVDESTPPNLPEALSSLSNPGVLPMPWTFWLLVVLIRHHEQQVAIKRLIRKETPHLLTQMTDERKVIGNWEIWTAFPEYLIVIDGQTGEELTISRHDEAHKICRFYDRSGVAYWSPEHRLFELFRNVPDARSSSYADLEMAVIIEPVNLDGPSTIPHGPLVESDFVRLSRYALSHTESIQNFVRRWDEPQNRLWLSCLIGDWDAAYHLATTQNEDGVAERCGQKATELERIWRQQEEARNWWSNREAQRQSESQNCSHHSTESVFAPDGS